MKALGAERGATIVIYAVAMAALLGLIGLAIDAAAVFAERRELSRGADAAVLAIAEDCALGVGDCTTPGAMVTAEAYADANADDGAAAIQSLVLDLGAREVHATTKTIDPADGTDRFKLFFLRALGIDSTTVTASAAAAWGYPTAAGALPLIISKCEYERYGPTETHTILYFHEGADADDCAAQAGSDKDGNGRLPGGFGWLSTDGECVSEITADLWAFEDPGTDPSSGCRDLLYNLIFDKTILVPFFDDVWGLGANGTYQIAGFGALHVTGYNFGGLLKEPSASTAPCSSEKRCISGYFTTDVVYDGPLGGQNFGVAVVKLIG